jgi:DNA-binding HxlR family transcriptional regulator
MSGTRYTQFCALARAAEIVSERWTLLIIRELLLAPMRFGDLADRLPGISPALLTARLNLLADSGIVRRASLPPPFNAQVYELTDTGRALQPALRELIRWGGRFLFPLREDDAFEPDWALLALDAIARRTPTPACRIGLRVRYAERRANFEVTGGPHGTKVAKTELLSGPTIEASFDVLLRVLTNELSIEAAVGRRQAKTQGNMRTLRKLPDLFELGDRRRDA